LPEANAMSIAYFDCFNGAAGDMIVGALIDAGLDSDELRQTLRALPIDGYSLSIEKVMRKGLAATRFDVKLDATAAQPHRHLRDVRKIIDAARLSNAVRQRAVAVFERLARAEAEVHGITVERVHFHEVGAVDAIVDIVGACWAVERLGIQRIVCSPIPVGSGIVTCAHGVLPIPAPATALLLKGVPIAASDEPGELTTPTGAAILTEFTDAFGPIPPMKIAHIGLGAGGRESPTRPNVLRVLIGVPDPSRDPERDQGGSVKGAEMGGRTADGIVVLEANIDDATPEVLGYAVERLLNAGALDAYTVPIQMKKSRPGALLTVLADPQRAAELEDILFAETTTFGVRRHEATRSKLDRRHETVETPYGPIRVKIGSRADRVVTTSPEFEDCRRAAEAHNVPLRDVMTAATDAWRRQQLADET